MTVSRLWAGASILAVAAIVYACSDTSRAPTTSSTAFLRTSTSVSGRADNVHIMSRGRAAENDPRLKAKLRAIEEKYAWIVAFHSRAVREMAITWLRTPAADRSAQKQCELAIEISLRTVERAQTNQALPRLSKEDNWQFMKPAALRTKCAIEAARYRVGSMSLFAAAATSLPRAMAPQSADFDYWTGQLHSAFSNAGYNGQDILNAMEAVLVAAEPVISTTDFEGVVMDANLMVESAVDWENYFNYVNSGGSGDPCSPDGPYYGDPACEQMMSLFRPQYIEAASWVDALMNGHVSSRTAGIVLWDAVGFCSGWLLGPSGAIAFAAMGSLAAAT